MAWGAGKLDFECAKSGVGAALSSASRVWFTISHGIVNEVYYPRVDQACIRDSGLIVTDGHGFLTLRRSVNARLLSNPWKMAFQPFC